MKLGAPLFLIILSVGLFAFVISPQYQEMKGMMDEQAKFKKSLENVRILDESRKELSDKYSQFSEEEKAKLEKVLPNTVDNVRLILHINDIADGRRISIQNIAVSGEANANNNTPRGNNAPNSDSVGTVGTISLSFNVSSTYETFKDFMRDLEQSLRLVDIKSFSVEKGEGLFNNYSVTLDTYWLR